MKAAIFRGIRDLQVEDVPEPTAGPGDIVVAVRAVGVCGSDLHSFTHGAFVEPGQIMGHEFAGEVVEIGDGVEGFATGDRVTAMPIVPCQSCRRCAEGRYNLCEVAWTQALAYGRPGAFAPRLAVPGAVSGGTVFHLDDALDDEAGAFAEPLGVAVHAVGLAGDVSGRTALVLGQGAIGLLITQVLRARGAGRVLVVERSELRADLARTFGAEALTALEQLDDALGEGGEIDVVFECSGAPVLAAAAVERVRGGGTIVSVALYDEPVALDVNMVVQKEIHLQGCIAYTSDEFADGLELLRSGAVQTAPMITRREPLERIGDAFEGQLSRGDAIKVLVLPA